MSALATAGLALTPTSSSRLVVDTISDYQSLVELKPTWDRLLAASAVTHPFVSHEWVRTWWECFGMGKRLHVLVVKDGDEPVAIAPFMVSENRMYGLRVRYLEFIYNDHTPRFDFIVRSGRPDAYAAIWDCLLDQRELWDVLKLCQLTSDSETVRQMTRLARLRNFRLGLWQSTTSPYLPIETPWETYVAALKAKHRSNLRNRQKRLAQLGPVQVEELEALEPASTALEEGFRIEALAWKENGGTAIRSRPEVHLFYTRFARRAAQMGWLRLHFLRVSGRRIAFDYSLAYNNRLYLLKPGYDPQYSQYSPYNLLLFEVLQDAFRDGMAEFDFLGNDDGWKQQWAAAKRQHVWLYAFPDRLRARLLHSAKFDLVPKLQKHRFYSSVRDRVLAWRKAA